MKAWVKSGLANTFRLKLEDHDDYLVVDTSVADAVAWENAHKGQSFQNSVSATSMLWTAWRALRRLQLVTETRFEQWVAKVVDFEIAADEAEEDADGLDPTQKDPLAG